MRIFFRLCVTFIGISTIFISSLYSLFYGWQQILLLCSAKYDDQFDHILFVRTYHICYIHKLRVHIFHRKNR